ncbi:hypothetical protein JCM18918_224 [Cutibacterium acnes JCM 18918]|nr:hypothetical protein JCM18918_224 [Cutibacterium acnes JCM 18918]
MVDPIRDIQIVLLTNMRHSPVVEPPNEFATGAFPLAHYVGSSLECIRHWLRTRG